jgi:hypothetical protein
MDSNDYKWELREKQREEVPKRRNLLSRLVWRLSCHQIV